MKCAPKVSVAIITYNQAHLIAKAIESVIAQKTNFDIEILIGDDCSTDGTREIIEVYSQLYPNLIVPVLHPVNLGHNGTLNALETYKYARGEYINLLDGDDYWTDPYKLQKQCDFLDQNPDYVICFHNARIIYQNGKTSELLNSLSMKSTFTTDDLIATEQVWFMATSSVLHRNCIKNYPDWYYKTLIGDIPKYILLSQYGKIGYLPDIMSVYYINNNGVSHSIRHDNAQILHNHIEMYKSINTHLDYVYDSTLKKHISNYYRLLFGLEKIYAKRLLLFFNYYLTLKPTWKEFRELIRLYLTPPSLLYVYSLFALTFYNLKIKALRTTIIKS